jgi:molecular chaperone GrpE
MTSRKKSRTGNDHPVAADASFEGAAPPDDAAPAPSAPAVGGVPAEPPEQAVQRLTTERDDWKDRYLRLAAALENSRKRMQRERAETWTRAQAEVVSGLLDALDDLGRVTSLDPGDAATGDLLAGVKLVERKMLHQLESAGLERVGQAGEPFDPNSHEAVTTAPAGSRDDHYTIAAVLQPGYRFGGALLRPARVQVRVWQDGGDDSGSET